MLNGRYSSLIFSLTIHLVFTFLLFIALPTTKLVPPKKKNPIKAIQSYLYAKPKIIHKTVKNKVIVQKPTISKEKVPTVKSVKVTNKTVSAIVKSTTKLTTKPTTATAVKPIPDKTTPQQQNNHQAISALEQLKQLRSQINDKILTEELAHQLRPRSLSIFNDLPEPVQHSKKQFGIIEKIGKMTTHYGSGITIIKGDDGNCTLKEDLTNVGMTGITAFSSFKCGSTKMEKMYRAHMDKVLKKLGKK